MPKERGQEWEHVRVVNKKLGGGADLKSSATIATNNNFWISSGYRIRAHLGVESISGVNKCEKVPEDFVRTFSKAESKKIAEKSNANRKRMLDVSCRIRGDSNSADNF